MRPITMMMSQKQAETQQGETLQFENCFGGYFSVLDDFGLKVIGKTHQLTLSGKNFLDLELVRDSANYTPISNGYRDLKIMLKANRTYTFSWDYALSGTTRIVTLNCGSLSYTLLNTNNQTVSPFKTFQLPDDNDVITLHISNIGRTDSFDEFISNFTFMQIEEGSTPTAYEPYCGGIPAPNPNYPVPIQCVKAGTKVEVCGKNLFNPQNCLSAYITNNRTITTNGCLLVYAKCKPLETYTISKTPGQRFTVGFTSVLPYGGCDVLGEISNYTASSITVTAPQNAKYVVAFCYNANYDTGITIIEMLNSIQIEIGSTATSRVPYVCNTITTPCDLYEGDIWYPMTGKVVHLWQMTTFNGTENWYQWGENGNTSIALAIKLENCVNFSYTQLTTNLIKTNRFSNYFIAAGFPPANKMAVMQTVPNGWIGININKTLAESINTLKQWNSYGNPLTVIYKLATPTIEQTTPQPISAPIGMVNVLSAPTELTPDLQVTMLTRRI